MGGEGKVQLLLIKEFQLNVKGNKNSSLGHPSNKLLQERTPDECENYWAKV